MQRARRIAIDGPAGSGKSTIGEQLARRLGYLYIDTGAMYRAVAWLALQEGVDINDGPALARLAQNAEIVIGHPKIEDGDTISPGIFAAHPLPALFPRYRHIQRCVRY